MAEFTNATGYVGNGTEWIPFDGGGEDPVASLAVVTHQPTDVGAETATFEGELTSLGEHSSAEVFFEWRATTSSSWHEIASRSRSAPTTYSYDIGDVLDAETEYEYQAVAEANGNRVTGSSVTFETDSASTIIIDNFEDGVDSDWTNDTHWATTTQVAWQGSYSAYRSGTSSLRAGRYTFDGAFEQGGPFISMPIHTTTTGVATIDFGRDDSNTLAGYTIRADWQGSGSGELRIGHRESGDADYTTLASTSASISPNQWYELVGLWHEDDTLHVWLYDDSGSLVASTDVMGEGATGDWWAVYAAPSEQTFIDYVRIRDEHPYTYTHYTNVSASTNDGGDSSSYTLEEPLSNSAWTDFFHDRYQDANASIVDASGRAGNQLEVDVNSGTHYGIDLKHEHPTSVGDEPTAVYQRFHMKFAENWETADDGKLPGFSGTGDSSAGTGGEAADGNAWTCRSGWNYATSVGEGVPMEWYIYHLDTSNYGEHDLWDETGSQFLAQPGTWYEVEQWLDLGTVNTNDAVLRTWVDGTLHYERTDLRFRESGGHDIRELYWNVYHGGGTTAPSTCQIYFDDIAVNHGSMPD